MTNKRLLTSLGLLALTAGSSSCLFGQQGEPFDPPASNAVTTTTVTNVTGTIIQLNYGESGAVEGFLPGTNILVTFPTNVTGGIGTLGAVGNSVTYSGTAETSTTGFEAVRVTTFTNNTTKVTYSSSTATTTKKAYGPTSGTVKQLNYDAETSVDGWDDGVGDRLHLCAPGVNRMHCYQHVDFCERFFPDYWRPDDCHREWRRPKWRAALTQPLPNSSAL